jgi:hypothetical protein
MKKNIASLKKAFFPAFIFAALLFSSCSKNELDDLQIPVTDAGKSDATNTTTDIGNIPPSIPLNAMIGITHGPCMGSCPNYTIKVSSDGNVEYNGINNVAIRGIVKFKISPDVAYQLGNMMEEEGFFNLAEQYIIIPDAQRFETSLVWKGKIKSVVDCGVNVPPNLLLMRQKVERVLDINRFVEPTGVSKSFQSTN